MGMGLGMGCCGVCEYCDGIKIPKSMSDAELLTKKIRVTVTGMVTDFPWDAAQWHKLNRVYDCPIIAITRILESGCPILSFQKSGSFPDLSEPLIEDLVQNRTIRWNPAFNACYQFPDLNPIWRPGFITCFGTLAPLDYLRHIQCMRIFQFPFVRSNAQLTMRPWGYYSDPPNVPPEVWPAGLDFGEVTFHWDEKCEMSCRGGRHLCHNVDLEGEATFEFI